MTTKQFQKILKKKHQAIIGAQFCFLVGFAIVIGSQHNALMERDQKAHEFQQTLHDISNWHQEVWRAHTDAMAHALLLTDAYESGGIEKMDEVFQGVEEYIGKSRDAKDKIKDELEKYGIIVPYYNPGAPEETPSVSFADPSN